MRLFIALELPDEVKQAAAKVMGRLKSSGADVKWIRPELMHVTLKFLGEVEPERAKAIGASLEEACGKTKPLALFMAGAGSFPARGKPKVVWLGLGGELEGLAKLSQRVYSSMEGLGFAPEDRPFSPHLTLGRMRRPEKGAKKGQDGAAELKRELAGLAGYRGPDFVVDRVGLIKSTLKPSGPVYEKLQAVKLKG